MTLRTIARALLPWSGASGKRPCVTTRRSSATIRFDRSTIPRASSQTTPRISFFASAGFTSTAARATNELLVQRSTCGRWNVTSCPFVDLTRGQGVSSSSGTVARTDPERQRKAKATKNPLSRKILHCGWRVCRSEEGDAVGGTFALAILRTLSIDDLFLCRFKAGLYRGRQACENQFNRLSGRVRDAAKTEFLLRKHTLLHHVASPLPHAIPKFRAHQYQRERTDLFALDQCGSLE